MTRTRERLRDDGEGLPGGGLVVCALDTELLGHWWYEGIAWLGAVVEECAQPGPRAGALWTTHSIAWSRFRSPAKAGERMSSPGAGVSSLGAGG